MWTKLLAVCGALLLSVCRGPLALAQQEDAEAEQSSDDGGVFSFLASPLQRAINRGLKPGGDLYAELDALDEEFGHYPIRTQWDAKVLCQALGKFPREGEALAEAAELLTLLTMRFDDVVPESTAEHVLSTEGARQLLRLYDLLDKAPAPPADQIDPRFSVLRVLSGLKLKIAAERVVQAARKPLAPDDYSWYSVLAEYAVDHPHRDEVFKELREPLPAEGIARALLDAGNRAAEEGGLAEHPFDTPAGRKRLADWLATRDPDRMHLAYAVAAALPWIKSPHRDRLLASALAHPDVDVQLQAAASAAKVGKPEGVALLAKHCLDWNYFTAAEELLVSLGREDAIPAAAREPEFQAKVQFADEFHYQYDLRPAEIEVIERRKLAWPLRQEPQAAYLLRSKVKAASALDDDEIVCGAVCNHVMVSPTLDGRPPEDAIAIGCYWEMQIESMVTELEVEDPADYAYMLRQWSGEKLEDAEVIAVAEFADELKYPQPSVGLAAARLKGEDGWVVLDGRRSAWYPRADMPPLGLEAEVLQLHVGRQLLGFKEQPDRKKFLPGPASPKDPKQVVAAYEQLMSQAKTGDDSRRRELLSEAYNPLADHFDAYVAAKAAVSGRPGDALIVETYEQFLRMVKADAENLGADAYEHYTPLGANLVSYAQALARTGRKGEIPALVKMFEPHWRHPLGYGMLATASHLAGEDEAAEACIQKLRDEMEDWYRCEEFSLLARIWHQRGRAEEAHELLVECLQKTAIDGRLASRGERAEYERWYQTHRSTYLELFPEAGEEKLQELGIKASLRR